MGTAVAVDLRHWVERTYRTNGSWSYAGLSSGGFAAAYLPLLDPLPVHATCGLGGFYDGRIPPLAKAATLAQHRASAIAHASRAPTLTYLAYGISDHSGPIQQTVEYTAALHAAHKHVIVNADAGGHTWVLWTEAFLQCFRTIEPAPHSA